MRAVGGYAEAGHRRAAILVMLTLALTPALSFTLFKDAASAASQQKRATALAQRTAEARWKKIESKELATIPAWASDTVREYWEDGKVWPCVLQQKKRKPAETVYKFRCSVVLLDLHYYLTPDRQTAYIPARGDPTSGGADCGSARTKWGCPLLLNPAYGSWDGPPEAFVPAEDGLLHPWWAGWYGFQIRVFFEKGKRKPAARCWGVCPYAGDRWAPFGVNRGGTGVE
jgi:hypothetical protein